MQVVARSPRSVIELDTATVTRPSHLRSDPIHSASGAPERRFLRVLERRLAFLIPLAASLPAAWVLVLHYHSIYNDALSRLANGYYVLYSRDPHLAAVGFVWNPLPSFVDIPFLIVKGWWAPLSRDAFAANLASCLFYALGCWQLYRYFEDMSLSRVLRWGLWLCFAANPLVFYYGINGMSESLFIFTLIVTARYLGRWLEWGNTRSLVISAIALGVAYLDRNEALAPAFVAGVTIGAVSFLRARGDRSLRRRIAFTDVYLYLSPFALSFGVWAVTSWLIVGHPFEQFSSQYGNAAQIKASSQRLFQQTLEGRFLYAVHGAETVAPFLAILVLLALLRVYWLRDLRALAPIAVMVSVLGFEIVAYSNRQIFPWYRYYIYACPAAVMMAACLAARSRADLSRPLVIRHTKTPALSVQHIRRTQSLVAGIALAMAAAGGASTAVTLGHLSGLSEQDRYQLAYILWPSTSEAKNSQLFKGYLGIRGLAHNLDSMHLPNGSVMVDNFTTCIPELILDSSHPKQFVIPNDEDYQEKFGVPYQFGIRYLLVPDPVTNPVDALNQHLPGLFASGQGLATLVREIRVASCPTFRLYRALPNST